MNYKTIESIPGVESKLGYQFENLIYNNFKSLLICAKIELDEIINWGPYYQTKTLRSEACQIDLLIQTKKCLYIFEIKYKEKIGKEILKELELKKNKLHYKKEKYSLKTGLIYSHEIDKQVIKSREVQYLISFKDLLSAKI